MDATAISGISMCHMRHMSHIPPGSTRPSPPFPLPGQLASSKSLTFAPFADFTNDCRWPCSIMRSASSRHVTVCTWQFWQVAEYKPTDILHMQGEGRRDEERQMRKHKGRRLTRVWYKYVQHYNRFETSESLTSLTRGFWFHSISFLMSNFRLPVF